jgi:mRNA interferase RelE/StbE
MNGAATQIASREFDAAFAALPPRVQEMIQRKIDIMGLRLAIFPHYRMTGSDKYRLRIGDYRVIYRFNPAKAEIDLITIGHRREIYRD